MSADKESRQSGIGSQNAIYARLGISLRWHPIVITAVCYRQSALFQVAFFATLTSAAGQAKGKRIDQVQAIAFWPSVGQCFLVLDENSVRSTMASSYRSRRSDGYIEEPDALLEPFKRSHKLLLYSRYRRLVCESATVAECGGTLSQRPQASGWLGTVHTHAASRTTRRQAASVQSAWTYRTFPARSHIVELACASTLQAEQP